MLYAQMISGMPEPGCNIFCWCSPAARVHDEHVGVNKVDNRSGGDGVSSFPQHVRARPLVLAKRRRAAVQRGEKRVVRRGAADDRHWSIAAAPGDGIAIAIAPRCGAGGGRFVRVEKL